MKACRRLFQGILAAVFIALAGAQVFSADQGLTVKGSTTVLPIVQVTSEEFMDRNPGIAISVQGGGSGVGIASLIDGTTDIASSSRKIKAEEAAKAQAAGVTPHENVIAMDGIAVVVHPSNPVSRLTRAQVKAIYTGRISDWSEIGGRKARIVVVSRDSSSGTFEAFEELALDKARVRPDALTSASNQTIAQIVAQTPGAIGYVGLVYLTKKVKTVEIDGVKCTEATVAGGTYPLSRPLYLYTNGAPRGNVKKYLDFVMGGQGRKIVREEGFVPVK
ncbi:MAG TPA: PstS family phosphate ABC transporter substrate-binding protein [Deltaproteobacteria bacterium]|nr:PstS family phosphate ABC transporter substrate-binding protein [Deltaproteobacteria bacterium]HOI07515.1 PstS family phosphate ABC transporter substrate-binding protein [Deltaproteobacteria bacterium]